MGANVDEPRNNWRPLFYEKAKPLVENLMKDPKTKIPDVVKAVNTQLWKVFGNNGKEITFKSGQTPLIYDPMSTIAYGYASCTGVSIMLVDVLRSVGVCARVVGTPAWHNNINEGNHKWFCNPSHFGEDKKRSPVFAARWDVNSTDVRYPMSWDINNKNIAGVDRSDYYNEVCAKCGTGRRMSILDE